MFLVITMWMIAFSMLILCGKLWIGPTIWDRLMALNLISAKTVMLLTIYGVYRQDVLLLDISLSYGIIGFLGITLFSRFIIRGGRHK